MKGCPIASLRERPIINRINAFLASPYYIIVMVLLTALANLLELEVLMYTLIALTVVYTCLFGADLLPLMPILVSGYVTPGRSNNPGRNPESVFSGISGMYLACLAIAMGAALIVHVIRERKKIKEAKPKLLWGLLALSAVYLLSGIGSKHYATIAGRNIFHALLQIAAIMVPYLLFTVFVDWKHVRLDYFAWVGFGAGCLLSMEILGIYCTQEVIVDGIVRRERIYTGWGMYNNMGGLLAMMIPYAFCLATKYRKGWIGTLAGSVFLICVLLTCSRSSILIAVPAYCVCGLLMLHYARNRRHNTIVLVGFIAAVLLAVIFFREQLMRLFSVLLNLGLNPNNRDTIYKEGLAKFLQSPILGSGFYSTGYEPWAWATLESFNNLIPPRWHNTIVQIMVCCGSVGILAYLFHRLQTVQLFLRRVTKENTFIACSLLVLLISCMFDCHFFNIGPVLFYSMALSFAENRPSSKPIESK